MILTNKFIFLLSLAGSSFAAPLVENEATKYEKRDIVNLDSRAAGVVPDSVTCGTVTIPRAKILDALTASFTPAFSDPSDNNPDGKEYPAFYGNKGSDRSGKTISVLSFAAARTAQAAGTLLEQPLGHRRTWRGGYAGLYRVIFDSAVPDTEGSYMGVVYHVNGGEFKRCTETAAPACPAPTPAPTTRTRRVWDILRRAAGRKPTKPKTKTPASCKKPTAKKPTTKKPTTKKPTTKKPTTKKPTTKKPTTKKPTTKRPTKRPSTKKPKKGGRF